MEIPRHPDGSVDWPTMNAWLRARWNARTTAPHVRQMRRQSAEWQRRWEEAGRPPVGHPDCPPTIRDEQS